MLTINSNVEATKKIWAIWSDYLCSKTNQDYLTLYIHVPYCTQKCRYCEYASKVTCSGVPEESIDYLESQFSTAAAIFKDEPIKAINFGGGTPNTLSPKQLQRILKMIPKYWNLQTGDEYELGFEFHPYHITPEHIAILKDSYINRLSMGVQSFDKGVLALENRLYVPRERILQIYTDTKSFTKVMNVDLLAGLMSQTSDILINDTHALLTIGVEAVTIYELHRLLRTRHYNKESTRPYITKMLLDLYAKQVAAPFPNYRYEGTTPEEFIHCNRFYRSDAHQFTYTYNPAPQGYNSVVAFSIDDKNIGSYPYSHFIPVDKAYQRLTNSLTMFYSLRDKANSDRPWWKKAFDTRTASIL